ncbi:uncharacterized protein [Cicer arietinum]|uniref:Uncharacterized protein LOC101491431 isoform X1 n=1 Tax=Cicer arietinum TaxID=3827 RepID=A0A1S2XTV6_CICAR|nr:uncharacterized protein LOC101491431 isoform X1 [Cicer arietinum]
MEDEKTNRHGKKKMHHSLGTLTIGGEGGITGLLVFGGALAIAGFMAVTSFATQRTKKKAIHPYQPIPQHLLLDDDQDIQYSTTQVEEDVTSCCSCLTSNVCTNTVSSSELPSVQSLIPEEKIDNEPNSACFHHQEIAFSDYSLPESATSSNENAVAEECSMSLFNNSTDHEQDEEKDESQDGLTSTETEVKDDDDVTETDEEDSSDLDHNEELIEHEFKNYYCESHVCSDLYSDGSYYAENEKAMTVPKEAIFNRTSNFSLVQNDQPSIFTTWIMPMMLLGLLMILVLLTSGLQESLYILDDGDSIIVP